MAPNEHRMAELIDAFARLQSGSERRRYILDHPIMISNPVVRVILSGPTQTGLEFLKAIDVAGAKVSPVAGGMSVGTNADRYPVGKGPIERLWRGVETKKIAQGFAIDQVKQPGFSDDLTFVYVKAVCDHCRKLVEADRRLACQRQRLVVEATEALVSANPPTSEEDIWQMRRDAGRYWVEIAGSYLVEVADPRILAHAATVGERLIGECEKRNDQVFLSRLLTRIGVLHIDPYTVGREVGIGRKLKAESEKNYRFALRLWQERLADELGSGYASLAPGERSMPDVETALATGENYLRRAMELQSGHERAWTGAALLQGLAAQRCLGEPVDDQDMIRLIDECLAALTPGGEDDERIVRLTGLRQALVGDSQAADESNDSAALTDGIEKQIQRFLGAPLQSIVDDLGQQLTVDTVSQLIGLLANRGGNGTGLAIIDRFRPWLSQLKLPNVIRERLWTSERTLLRGWYRDQQNPDPNPVYSRPLPAGVARRDPAVDKRVAELLTVALGSGEGDREEEGLDALHQAAKLDPTLFGANHDALTYFQGVLSIGAGTNVFNQRDFGRATAHYVTALACYLVAGLESGVYDSLQRLEDIVTSFDHAANFRLVRALGHFANDIEVLTGTAGSERLQSIYRRASRLWVSRSGEPAIDLDTVFLTLRLAKGCRFASCMRAERRYDWNTDEEALARLDAIRAAKAEPALAAHDMAPRDYRDPEVLLVGRSGIHELLPGSSAEQQFENLRVAFDDYLARRMTAEGIGSLRERKALIDPWQPPELMSVHDAQSALDAETVLIDYYLGESRDGEPTLYAICLTSEDAALFSTPMGGTRPGEIAYASGAHVPLTPIQRLVRDVRTGTNSMPGPFRAISRQGEEALQEGMQIMFGALADFLQASRGKGRHHLCIVPHGALHFMPAHLLGPAGSGIGNDWTVTYLPLVELLMDTPAEPAHLRHDAESAVGLDFRDGVHPGLPPLERAPISAREIAALLGGQALVNAEATEMRVMSALAQSRHFHLFTHGQQCVYAAAFHALYLHPDASTDGVLEAYKLLPLDLRSLDVLTLSACETALGRFDVGDNLMGLPGSLLFAGVRTIVGTLWPVSAPVAKLFFAEFYKAIVEGSSKLAAFAGAQRATQAEAPEYRDWGAFYFIGRW